MKRSTGSFFVTAATLAAMNVSLARSGYATSPVPLLADLAISGIGLAFALTREAPGGARLRDLNMAVPCPGIGGSCRNYFHPPKGELLVPVVLPDGKTGMVCRPDARVLGQGGPEPVSVEVVEVRQLGARRRTGVVDGVID